MNRPLLFASSVLLLGSLFAVSATAVALDLGLVQSPFLEAVVLVVFGGFTLIGALQLGWRGVRRVRRFVG
jgi:hypothetical protein